MCYRFELLEFEDCLFENVDATYILHLEGNGRIDHIHDQLKTYHPSKKVYIVFNKGYKKCKKDLHIQGVPYDVIHANMTVFEHAQHYKHILVLEDDFIFSKEVTTHAKHVDDFLQKDTLFVYQLGCAPFVALPIDMQHYRVFSQAAHANIYSSLSKKKLINDYNDNKMIGTLKGLDNYILITIPTYMYHKPLCYQIFPYTLSRQGWFNNHKGLLSYIAPILKYITNTFLSFTNLENEPEPGFSIMYFLGKSLTIILLLILLWILYRFACLLCTGLKGKRLRR